MKNNERIYANICLILFILGSIIFLAQFIMNTDMMNGGFATIILSGFLAFATLIFFIVFNKRDREKSKIMNNRDIIGRWNFPKEQIQKNKKEVEEYKFISRIGSSILGIIIFLIGVFIFIIDDNSGIQYLLLMAGVAIFIVMVVFLITEIRYRRIINDQDGVIFTHSGMYYKGDIYIWDGIASKLESVLIDPQDNNNLLVVFRELKGRSLSRGLGMLRILIPDGMHKEAEKVVGIYNLEIEDEVMEYIKSSHDIEE